MIRARNQASRPKHYSKSVRDLLDQITAASRRTCNLELRICGLNRCRKILEDGQFAPGCFPVRQHREIVSELAQLNHAIDANIELWFRLAGRLQKIAGPSADFLAMIKAHEAGGASCSR